MNEFPSKFLEMDTFSSLIHRLSFPLSASTGLGGIHRNFSTLTMAPTVELQLKDFKVCNSTEENCTATVTATANENSRSWQVPTSSQQQIDLIGSNGGIIMSENSNIHLPLADFVMENFEVSLLTVIVLCYLVFGFTHWIFSKVISWSPVKTLCEFILSHLTFLLILPFFLTLLLANALLRGVTRSILQFVYKGRYSILGGSDAFWAHNDVYANTTNFYALYVLEGQCNIEKIRETIQQKVIEKRIPSNEKLMYSRLKHKIVKKLGYFCSERIPESDFHINNHVKFVEVASYLDGNENSTLKVEPAKISMTESQVFGAIGEMCNVPLDDSKPQWEILIVPNFIYNKDFENENNENENQNGAKQYYGLIYRIHHSFMDGISAGYTLQTAMADSPPRLAIDPMKKINIPLYQKLLMYILLIVVGPVNLIKAILQSDKNSFHGPSLAGPKTVGWSRPVDLNALKEIKTKTKTSTTAILLSCLGSSIRSLAIEKKVNVPDKINAFITIAMLPYPNSHPQNRFTLSVLPIKIGLNTCLERLKAAYKSLCDLNCSPDIILSFHFIRIVGLFPAVLINIFADLVHTTMLLSNVPGPAQTTYMFGGHRLVDATCWSPLKNKIGIGMSLFSYAGRVRASMVSDHAVLPNSSDVTHLIDAFEKEIKTLGGNAGVTKEDDIFHKLN